jgi:16S rRNA (guanine527-N7)-methyltransferase
MASGPTRARSGARRGSKPDAIEAGLIALAKRYGLEEDAKPKLLVLLRLLSEDPLAPSAIRSPQAVLRDHLADSLVALELEPVRAASAVLDLGAGAGLPGLALAIALPLVRFTLLEAAARKCHFLERAVEAAGIANATVVHERAETFGAGQEGYEAVTARAVAAPAVTAEYAAPLLEVGGSLLLWRGRRDPEADVALNAAASELGLGEPSVHHVRPYEGAQNRHLYVLRKLGGTPRRFPRRPGIALKRPLGGQSTRPRSSSDRAQR